MEDPKTDAAPIRNRAIRRDAAAARNLPDLYRQLDLARETLAKAKAQAPDVHTIQMNIGSEGVGYAPADRKAFAELVLKDMQDKVTATESQIKALGFEVD